MLEDDRDVKQSDIAVFITASSPVEKTKRAYDTARLSLDNVHININSLKQEIIDQNVQYCKSNDISYTVSESNGYPAKGKNATYDWFKEFDYRWLVPMDGDDYFSPDAYRVFNTLVRDFNPDIGILVQGKSVRYEDGEELDTDLFHRKMFYNAYFSNIQMMEKMTSSTTGAMRASRCVLFSRETVVNNIARMDENIRGFEDFAAILRYNHFKKTKDLHVVNFNCQYDSYIYDISEEGDHAFAINRKPEDFSENMVDFWRGLEGYDYYLDAADYLDMVTVWPK